MYNTTLYINTGFNSMNSPDSVSLLETAAQSKVTVPALDLYQIQELDQVKINVSSYASIRDADYMLLVNDQDATDFGFYSIEDIQMTDMHTAVVSILINPTLTVVGTTGLSMLEFTDGICARHHVASNDDVFGAYCEDDPYMAPAETMKIKSKKPDFGENDDPSVLDDGVTFLESTVDLYHTYYEISTTGVDPRGIDYKSAGGVNSVTVPSIYGAGDPWTWTGGQYTPPLTKARMQKSLSGYYVTQMPSVTLYIADNGDANWSNVNVDWIKDAMAVVRSLGLESSILAQYTIPAFMVEGIPYTHGELTSITGKRVTYALSDLPFIPSEYLGDYNYTVKNNRIFYGNNCKYNIVSIASGNSAAFLPEEIYASGENAPTIQMRVDPRPDGAPYFRFDRFRGITDNEDPDLFFTNAVKGLQWQNVPLVYEGGSGSLLNQYAYSAEMAMLGENSLYGVNSNIFQKSQIIPGAMVSAGQSVLSGLGGNPVNINEDTGWLTPAQMRYGYVGAHPGGGAVRAAASAASSVMGSIYNGVVKGKAIEASNRHLANAYNINANTEMQNLLIANNVVAPSMNFPISESIRDYVGNTCLVYRTYYSKNDVERIDKILTMYGYRHTIPITSALLTNRSKFNYIEAKGVSIKNAGVPKWLRDAITEQFSSGVRFWHVPIDTNAYTDGTNT